MTNDEQQFLAESLRRITQGPQNPYVNYAPPSDNRRQMAARDFAADQRAIDNKRRIAQNLMQQSQSSPGLISAGRVSRAGASPMTAFAQALQGYTAGKNLKDAREKESVLSKAMAESAAAQGSLEAEKIAKEDARYQSDEARKDREEAREIQGQQEEFDQNDIDRDYVSVVNSDGTGMTTIRQGDDVPEGMVLADDYYSGLKEKGKGSGSKSATQSVAEYRAESLRSAREQMVNVVNDGYTPTGWTGWADKIANASDLTRWIASPEGKKFQSAAASAKEALLRTATGAAAPEGENREYIKTLIPTVGDGREVLEFKIEKLARFQDILDESADIDFKDNKDAADLAWMNAAQRLQDEDIPQDNAQQEAGSERVKTINGVTYVKRGEDWFPQ